jgi:hypothetical protein
MQWWVKNIWRVAMQKNMLYQLLVLVVCSAHCLYASERDKDEKHEKSYKLIPVPIDKRLGTFQVTSNEYALSFRYPLLAISHINDEVRYFDEAWYSKDTRENQDKRYEFTILNLVENSVQTVKTARPIWELKFSPCRNYLAYFDGDRNLGLLNLTTQDTYDFPTSEVHKICFLKGDKVVPFDQLTNFTPLLKELNNIVVAYASSPMLAVVSELDLSVWGLGDGKPEELNRVGFSGKIGGVENLVSNGHCDIVGSFFWKLGPNYMSRQALLAIKNCLDPRAKFIDVPKVWEPDDITFFHDSRQLALTSKRSEKMDVCNLEDDKPKLIEQPLPFVLPLSYELQKVRFFKDKIIAIVSRYDGGGLHKTSLVVKKNNSDKVMVFPLDGDLVHISGGHVITTTVPFDGQIWLYKLAEG